jgi:O-antigen ligase
LGRVFLRTGRDLRDVLSVLVIGGLIYTLPELWEIRMSPMLHVNIYGFASRTDWLQNIRMGGYRPTVFMGHGLVVGFFMFICTTAAVAMHRAGRRAIGGIPLGAVVAVMFLMLVLCKAAAALVYGAVGFFLIRYLSIKAQLRVIVVLGLIVVSYPVLRLTNIFPTESILAAARVMGKDRADSLQFRFDNEDILLIKAEERPWFGWGGFSRERVYDAETGKDIVIQDGHWIPLFGTHGAVGFTCYYFLLLLPVFQAWRKMRNITSRADRILLTALGFIVSICCVNELPNMHLPNLQFFFAAGLGVLLTEIPKIAAQQRKDSDPAALDSQPSDLRSAARSGGIATPAPERG